LEPIEPVVKGLQLEIFLESLLNVLASTGAAMKTATTVDQKVIPAINIQGTVLESVTNGLKNRLNLLKSKKVFTE
jgi:translation initiation factor 1 (eIF-1/SUI1)